MRYAALAHVFVVRLAHQPYKNCDNAFFSGQYRYETMGQIWGKPLKQKSKSFEINNLDFEMWSH